MKGSGEQTRDLLYVEDCAESVVKAALTEAVEGRIVNAGTGRDVSVNQTRRSAAHRGTGWSAWLTTTRRRRS